MKKSFIAPIIYTVIMAVLWSFCFYNSLGTTGIGVGICFGIAFFPLGKFLFSLLDKKDNKENKDKKE